MTGPKIHTVQYSDDLSQANGPDVVSMLMYCCYLCERMIKYALFCEIFSKINVDVTPHEGL